MEAKLGEKWHKARHEWVLCKGNRLSCLNIRKILKFCSDTLDVENFCHKKVLQGLRRALGDIVLLIFIDFNYNLLLKYFFRTADLSRRLQFPHAFPWNVQAIMETIP